MTPPATSWIFLRGLTRESRHWGDFVAQFEQAVPASRVLALDLPGNGALNQRPSPTRVQDMVAHVRAELALRQLAPPYYVLALSLGAMVAVAWAQAHPEEIAAQVLINTSLRPFSPFYQRLRPRSLGRLLKLLLGLGGPEAWERSILRLTSERADEAVLARWLALRRERPVSRLNALRQLLAAARYSAPLAPPAVATLLLASAPDQLVSVACSETLARQWQCPLRVHASAGHDLPLDDGPWVAAQVRACLRSGFWRPVTQLP